MNSDAEAPTDHRRRHPWLKRSLWAFVILLAGLVAFHRPILKGIIHLVGTRVAASQGLDVDFDVKGSVLNDLTISSLKSTGTPSPLLPRADVGRFTARYDLHAALRKDFEHALKSVTIHNGDIELDLRHLPVPKAAEPKIKVEGKVAPLVWPERIDIKDLNLTLTLVSGKRLVIRGLTFQVAEGEVGTFACKEVRLEPDGLALGPLDAKVAWESRKATIRDLNLPQNVKIESLVADLGGWQKGDARAEVTARFGSAPFEVAGTISGMWSASQQIQASAHVSELRDTELHALGLPADVRFENAELDMDVQGNPKDLPGLTASMTAKAANIRAAGALADQVAANLAVSGGRAELKSARIVRTGNTVEITAGAALPADLAQWRKTPWQAQASGSLTNVADMLANPPPVAGSYVLNATARGVGTTPTEVTGELNAQNPSFQAYRLPRLGATFSLNGKEARLELPNLQPGQNNRVSLKAQLSLEDAMPVKLDVDAAISNVPALFASTGLKPPPEPISGQVAAQVRVESGIADLRAKRFDTTSGQIVLQGSGLHYGAGSLGTLRTTAKLRDGRVTVETLEAQLDEQNRLSFNGWAAIAAPFAFEGKAHLELAELTTLNGLLTAFKAPPMESGAVFGQIEGTGQVQPFTAKGTLNVSASKVRTSKMPDAADAAVEATFEGTELNLGTLNVSLGPWKISAKGTVNERQANLAELEVWQNDTRLLNGRAVFPYDALSGGQGAPMDVSVVAKDLQVDQILKAAGIDNIPAGTLNANIQLGGRGDAATGEVHAEVANVKIPKSPRSFEDASAKLDVRLADKRAQINLVATQPPLQALTLEANLPVNLPQVVREPAKFAATPLEARVQMPESDLGFIRDFAPDLIQSAPVRGRIDATIGGTVGEPLIDAAIDVTAPEIGWKKPDLPSVRDVRLHLRAVDRTLRVEEASVILAGGSVRLNGTVDATDLKTPKVDLTVVAQQALAYRDPSTSLRADGTLTCQGTLASSHVAGHIDLVRGRLFKEIDFMPALSLPSDVPPLPPDTQRRNTQLVLPPLVKDWTFDIQVQTRDPFMIAGNVANGAISGHASLTGTGAAPVLTGAATVDRMLLRLPYSVIKVTEGDITVDPASPLDPALDIRGESRVGSTDVTVYVYGHTSDPKTRFTSIPPMPEADVVALLATGTSLNGSSNEVAADAAGRAIFLFVKELYRKVRNKPKVVDDEPPRMSISINPSAAERTDDNAQVSYELTDQWRAVAHFGQSGRVRAFLEYLLHFGKAARAVDEKPNLARVAPNDER